MLRDHLIMGEMIGDDPGLMWLSHLSIELKKYFHNLIGISFLIVYFASFTK
jgi:hypothetical protein